MTALNTAEDWLKLRQQSQDQVIADAIRETAGRKVGLPSVLMDYQAEAIRLLDTTGTNVLVIEKSRRIGFTWGLASYAVLKASRSKSARGMDVMYISYAQDMTREFIDACAMWARAFSIAAMEMEEWLFEDNDKDGTKRSIQAFRIRFASGFEIMALSSAPRTLRGKQGVVIIDEAAFVDSLEELLKAALAFLNWGGQVIVVSTHNGTDNAFNTLVNDVKAGRKPYHHRFIDFDKALDQGLYQRICLVKGETWTPEKQAAWRAEIVASYGSAADEELFCIPAQGTGAWLTHDLIERRMTLETASTTLRWQWPLGYLNWPKTQQAQYMQERLFDLDQILKQLSPHERHVFGFDFARVANGDLSILKLDAIDHVTVRQLRLCLEMRGVPFDEQTQFIDHIIVKTPRFSGGAFDATGSGHYVAEALSRKYGKYDLDLSVGGAIAEIKLSQSWYSVNMPPVKAAFEDGLITLAKDDEHLSDLRVVKLVRGIPLIPDVRKGSVGLKRHGDFAVATALCWFASKMNCGEYDYISNHRGGRGEGDGFWTAGDDFDNEHEKDWRAAVDLSGGEI